MEDFKSLTERQNEVLRKYVREGTKNFDRGEYRVLQTIKENSFKAIIKEKEAKEILEYILSVPQEWKRKFK